ncbi:MAG: efflux RND transporter periplasmic adaptor subunit, partial [Acidobacteriota bacterium]|nr:efflux RND transporter periplasmic adaptor subunit [Acidobacteriota bacterium]
MKWRWLILVVIAAIGVVAVTSGAGIFQNKTRHWLEIAEEPFVRRIDASGELRSSNNAMVGCPTITSEWNFTLTWLADEGTQVQPGQPVARFDGQRLQDRLQIAQTRLETSRTELERTRITQQSKLEQLILEQAEARARFSQLEQKLAVPKTMQAASELEKILLDREFGELELELIAKRIETQRDNRKATIGSAEYRVSEYTREIEQLQSDIEALSVVASRAGFVVHAASWNGEKPKVGETVWSGRSIIEIADLSQMEVLAEVAERDARHVQIGQSVEVRLDASPDRVFTGRISSLGRLFRTKSPTIPTMIFDATIQIDEADADLMRPGMAAG